MFRHVEACRSEPHPMGMYGRARTFFFLFFSKWHRALQISATVLVLFLTSPKWFLLLGVRSCLVIQVLVMNDVVFSSFCLQPKSLVVSRVADGHTCCCSACRRGQHCRVCSDVWSSWPQEQVGVGASWTFRPM